jgi:hypothetical protein
MMTPEQRYFAQLLYKTSFLDQISYSYFGTTSNRLCVIQLVHTKAAGRKSACDASLKAPGRFFELSSLVCNLDGVCSQV